MTDFGSWIRENWYQLGSFFVQVGFLFLAISFAGKILRALRASQEQVGALLKISVTDNSPDRHTAERSAHVASEASPYWLQPAPSLSSASVAETRTPEFIAATKTASGPGFFGWWKEPMGITAGRSSFHRALRWLQSPAHS